MSKKRIDIIGAAAGWGTTYHDTETGPDELRAFGLAEKLHDHGLNIGWQKIIHPTQRAMGAESFAPEDTKPHVMELDNNICDEVTQSLTAGHFPLVVGGDHSIAVGTWSGVTSALDAVQEFGLIWIDAHLDANTLETTPSQAFHGMPVACLLGYGDPELVNLKIAKAKLNPQHLVLVGVRSYERGEAALLESLGIRVFMMDEIAEKGFHAVMQEALDIVSSNTKGFGISIDLDCFDPTEAPGVNTPAPQGLLQSEALPVFKELVANNPTFRALEIAEYNPTTDMDHKTAQLTVEIAKSLL